MNVCQNVFKLRTKEVSKVLKSLQVITRYIQNICNYTKVSFISLSVKLFSFIDL